MKKVIAYIRTSTLRQAVSMKNQKLEIKKYCKNNNLLSVKDNLEFIEKKNSNKTGFETIRDDNFNVRLTQRTLDDYR